MNWNVGAYLRLSRDDEREGESLSIENQRAILTDYIAKHGWTLTDTYIDDGLTGTNFDRPGFQRMIDDVRNGKINCVVVKDLSRFGRNYIQIGEYTDYLFPALGCRFIAINDGIDTLEKENELMPFKNLLNEWYSRDQSKKVKSAHRARAENGFNLGAYPPFGYVKNPNRKPPYFIDEPAARIVRKIFDMRCQGQGYRTIATQLNDAGVITPRDRYYELRETPNPRNVTHKWTDVTVKQLLTNEAYIGNLVQFKCGTISYKNKKIVSKPEEEWIRVENTHEPIVTMEQWSMAQKLAESSRSFRSNKDGEISLFSGLLECADCHKGMKLTRDYNVRKDGHRNNHHAYICGTYSGGGKNACTPHRTRQSIFESLVLADVREKAKAVQIDEEKVAAELRKKLQSATSEEQKAVAKQLASIEKRLADLDRLTKKLYEEMVLGDLPRESVLSMIEDYKKEKNEKLLLKEELEKKKTHSQSVEKDIGEWVSLMKKYKDVETLDRELLMKLVRRIIVGQKEVVDGKERQEITIVYNFVGEL